MSAADKNPMFKCENFETVNYRYLKKTSKQLMQNVRANLLPAHVTS